ncbi:MAG TPA: hypothetical protein VK081_14310 [Planctomycetota bacterium]|nr:hypothetical protein [Planctomycetota bacterium]
MSKFSALALSATLALFASCSTFTWRGQASDSGMADPSRGLKDMATLSSEYETEKFFAGIRRRMDGRSNAFSRDLDSITATIDRHLFNYSVDDPYVNFPTEYGPIDNTLRSAVKTVAPLPVTQDLMRR